MTKLGISLRYLKDLDRQLYWIIHNIDLDFYQDARAKALGIRQGLAFVFKNPELYVLHQPHLDTRPPRLNITRRLRRRREGNASVGIDGVDAVADVGL
jgi:hypothetical protein